MTQGPPSSPSAEPEPILADAASVVARRLAQAHRAAALSGAGMSAESGIPTFRSGANALWRNYRPEQLATPEAFAADPAVVWAWYAERIAALRRATYNAGHAALVRIAAAVPELSVVTQNVDGLHALAGSSNVIELHGNIRRARCTRCQETRDVTEFAFTPNVLPRCACAGMLRPGVVWFGEALPPGVFERAEAAAASADVFVVAGTSAVVYPAAGLVGIAKDAGAFVVEINPEETGASSICDLSVRAKTGEFLPQVVGALESLRRGQT